MQTDNVMYELAKKEKRKVKLLQSPGIFIFLNKKDDGCNWLIIFVEYLIYCYASD